MAEAVAAAALKIETLQRNDRILHIEGLLRELAFVVPLIVAPRLVTFAFIECYKQVFLVVREADVTRIRYGGGHRSVFGLIPRIVYQHIIQQTGFPVLMPNPDTHVVDTIEEGSVFEFDGLLLLTDIGDECVHLLPGIRHEVVGGEKTAYGDEDNKDGQRGQYARKRYSRRFHGEQFVVFAEIAHCHDSRQKRSQRQRHGDGRSRRVPQQFEDDAEVESFPDKVVDIKPQEVHKEYERHDEEGKNHRPYI